MESPTYHILIDQEPTGGFCTIAPAFPGLEGHGDTEDDAVQSLGELIYAELVQCLANDKPLPEDVDDSYLDDEEEEYGAEWATITIDGLPEEKL